MLKFIRSESALILGFVITALAYGPGSFLFTGEFGLPLFSVLFVLVFIVMLLLSFSAVRHADHLAELLGEPYGTLILTIAVITIEVALISAIMLSGNAAPTLARDTMMAVLMIVMNGVVGVVLLVGGFHHSEQEYNLRGAVAFLTVLVTLATMTLILPNFTESTPDPSLNRVQSELFAVITIVLYVTFLAIQTVRHRSFFVQPGREDGDDDHHDLTGGGSVPYHAIMLVLTLVPAVLLSKKLAILVDFGIATWSLPVALGGIVIASLVLAPEALAAFHSARQNYLQRAVNICLGSALATIGLTVPAVLAISIYSGQEIQLGIGNTDMTLLILTMFVSALTFGGVRTNMLQGAVHLVIFVVYLVLVFNP
ncbi:MAG: calcium:proton antiporter [Hyphomicrobiales bacterium]|nr:calcium:proton antiporter [Hyphomicrobiales bacterium]MCP4999599.1 calcium:proton antiporter [Hyphomicrobiales bacterium]